MKDKTRISIHEAGHVTMYLLWDLTWESAELTVDDDGNCRGVVHRNSYEIIDTRKRFFIKDWTISMAGFLAEEIYLGKELDMKTDSIGSANDFLTAQTEAFKFMSEEVYLTQFAPFGMSLTKQILKKNWINCVLKVGELLHHNHKIKPDQLKPFITTLYKPLDSTLNDIVKQTNWK